MPVDIAGITISNTAAGLVCTTGQSMTIDSSGRVSRPYQTMFTCGAQGSGWTLLAGQYSFGNGHKPVNTSFVAGVNVGSCLNTTNARFTAPVSGLYYFQFCSYLYIGIQTQSDYMDAWFYVNGSALNKQPSGSYNYRRRGFGMPLGAGYYDMHMNEQYYLDANDYVDVYIFGSAYGSQPGGQWYDYYTNFNGFLIG